MKSSHGNSSHRKPLKLKSIVFFCCKLFFSLNFYFKELASGEQWLLGSYHLYYSNHTNQPLHNFYYLLFWCIYDVRSFVMLLFLYSCRQCFLLLPRFVRRSRDFFLSFLSTFLNLGLFGTTWTHCRR